MNKIGLKNVDCGSACASLHQTGPDYLLFILPSRQSPNCWLCYEKLKLFAFHIILSPTPLHHLPIIWKAFITKSLSFLKSHSCPTYITFKWIQNLCWSPRIWTTESRYSTFISFHQILQLQISNSIQTLNFTCKYKVFKQLHSIPDICHFFCTGSIFKFQILHPKIDQKHPKHSKMSLKSKMYAVFVFNLENFTPDRIFLHGHRPWCP